MTDQLDSHIKVKWTFISYLQKIQIQMDHKSKQEKESNKAFKEILRERLHDVGVVKDS